MDVTGQDILHTSYFILHISYLVKQIFGKIFNFQFSIFNSLNLPFHIARKISFSKEKSFSKTISRVAIVAIALSVAVMIGANAFVTGFKKTISEKVFGFWGHIHINHINTNESFDVTPLSLDQPFYPFIDTVGQTCFTAPDAKHEKEVETCTHQGIRHIQAVVNKEGVIKTKTQMEGIILRGVGKDFDWKFLKRYLTSGDTMQLSDDGISDAVLISDITAQRLEVGLGDNFLVYFVKNGEQLVRKFKICGTFKTGLEEYDQKYAICDIKQLQKLNNWRPYCQVRALELVLDSIRSDKFATTLPNPPEEIRSVLVQSVYPEDTLVPGLVSKFNFDAPPAQNGIYISESLAKERNLSVGNDFNFTCQIGDRVWKKSFQIKGLVQSQKLVAFADYRLLDSVNQDLAPQIGAFEIFVDDYRDIAAFGDYIYYKATEPDQYAMTMRELFPNIFDWLGMLDLNEKVIFTIMTFICIINMITALLILIIDRTYMIGILKALGMSNFRISQVFLYNAAFIIGWGLLLGNAVGLGFCFLQDKLKFIKLPEDTYYVSYAPVEINFIAVLLINIVALTVILAALMLPSLWVSRINPVKAIRFK